LADSGRGAEQGHGKLPFLTVGEYLHTWKLKHSTTKTASAAFHLNNKEGKHELKVNY